MILEKTAIPINCIPVSPVTNRLATTPKIPIRPRTMHTPPNRLPKDGALSMATPRMIKHITMKRLPTKKNVLVMPWVDCQPTLVEGDSAAPNVPQRGFYQSEQFQVFYRQNWSSFLERDSDLVPAEMKAIGEMLCDRFLHVTNPLY